MIFNLILVQFSPHLGQLFALLLIQRADHESKGLRSHCQRLTPLRMLQSRLEAREKLFVGPSILIPPNVVRAQLTEEIPHKINADTAGRLQQVHGRRALLANKLRAAGFPNIEEN